jgi:hypothetical protein
MKYFNSLPKVVYTDKNNTRTLYTNLMSRASVIPSVLNNALSFYDYDIQDEDTPEIVAHKYYGDINRFWIVLYCNQINDPLWDWPLSNRKFQQYMANKYNGSNSNPSGLYPDSIHHYEIVKLKTSSSTTQTQEERIICSQEDYDAATFNDYPIITVGSETISFVITKKIVTNYEYEYELNESKRKIKILNKEYAAQFEKEFVNLMKN